jgi:aminopeptidase N
MKRILISILLILSVVSFGQNNDSAKIKEWVKIYRASSPKINDLVHTKLEVSFDFKKSQLYGKAWITLHPHFYSTDTLCLDAKHMNINEISLVNGGKQVPLKYFYDSLNLRIILDKKYQSGENYTVFISYVSKPNEIKRNGSTAITGSKGLYFINPTGLDKNKPTQIWTQGETESNSVWFPTIDKPNQKTTDEISITVPEKYVTLSNGLLASQKRNPDGTRTDTWKMELPHAPYLVMMAVGEFSVIKDSYKGKEVSYYVEKNYASVARKIFGYTPEMIAFFSKITGIDYPWPKYSQIVVRDYISGAMENTTATVHGDFAQQDARQLVDENIWEDGIAHELFHHWFGDYVTAESWSNLPLNESFADFSETLWETYKHGKDAGDEHNYNALDDYLYSNSSDKELVRFHYADREDMFDMVSYQKGGRVLKMLKNYVGDSAFYRSINLYLRNRKFNSAEAHDLRLAFEEITGQDLNWFWNQWFYGKGHPELDINYHYDPARKVESVYVRQMQKGQIFTLPVAVDVYSKSSKKRYMVTLSHEADTLEFHVPEKPDLINLDGEKILLCEKDDHKTIDDFIYQYRYAGLYADRREALDYASKYQEVDPKALRLLLSGLSDDYYGLRINSINKLNLEKDSVRVLAAPVLTVLAKSDPKSLVRAAALAGLGKYKNAKYRDLFIKSLNDSSYSIAGSALDALALIDSIAAIEKAKVLSVLKVKGNLSEAVNNVLFTYSSENDFDSLSEKFNRLPYGDEKLYTLHSFAGYLRHIKGEENFRKGIDLIVGFRNDAPKQYQDQLNTYINGAILNELAGFKENNGMTQQAEYVRSQIPEADSCKKIKGLTEDILKKYAGDYDLNGTNLKIVLQRNSVLTLKFPDQASMDLVAVSKTKFSVRFMKGYVIDFEISDAGNVTGLILSSKETGEMKAVKKN